MARLILLGAGGFVGRTVSEGFASSSRCQLVPVDSARCNLCDADAVASLFDEIKPDESDTILFASAITRLVDNSFAAMVENLTMVESVVVGLASRPDPIARLIFLSSTDLYGMESATPFSEEDRPAPYDYYGVAKIASEYLLAMAQAPRVITVLRLSGLYGPHDRGFSAVGRMVASADREGKIRLFQRGVSRRDFLFAPDLVRIVRSLMDLPIPLAAEEPVRECYNINPGQPRSIAGIARLIADRFPRPVTLELVEQDEGAPRPLGAIYSGQRFRAAFPDFFFTPLEHGIDAYLQPMRAG